jgi:hypothetical protein
VWNLGALWVINTAAELLLTGSSVLAEFDDEVAFLDPWSQFSRGLTPAGNLAASEQAQRPGCWMLIAGALEAVSLDRGPQALSFATAVDSAVVNPHHGA